MKAGRKSQKNPGPVKRGECVAEREAVYERTRSGVDLAAERCREVLKAAYGKRFGGLVVYGSSARGEADPESDIDLLVLLRGPFDYFKELRAITDVLYPLQLETDRLLSAKPAALNEYRNGRLQLYRNALRDGVTL
ncbi:MAG: nucleotidyltransferase domain-containing protein [Deltaproteobacteria bacterium]|nr:nucleotidyltransferase domain-containing protein [Deltaproteobacteria bacterium]